MFREGRWWWDFEQQLHWLSSIFFVQPVPLSFVSGPDIHLLQFITEYISYSGHFKETKLSFFSSTMYVLLMFFSLLSKSTNRQRVSSHWTTFWLIKAIWLRVKNNIKAFQVWEYKYQTDYEEVKKHWVVPFPPWQWMKGQKMERESERWGGKLVCNRKGQCTRNTEKRRENKIFGCKTGWHSTGAGSLVVTGLVEYGGVHCYT